MPQYWISGVIVHRSATRGALVQNPLCLQKPNSVYLNELNWEVIILWITATLRQNAAEEKPEKEKTEKNSRLKRLKKRGRDEEFARPSPEGGEKPIGSSLPQSRVSLNLNMATNREETLEDVFQCAVCLCMPRCNMYQCKNGGHLVCQICHNKLPSPVCPTCRCPMPRTPIRNRAAEQAIQRMTCKYSEYGCTFVKAEEVKTHEVNCNYKNVKCPYWLCNAMVPIGSVTDHVKSTHHGLTVDNKVIHDILYIFVFLKLYSTQPALSSSNPL